MPAKQRIKFSAAWEEARGLVWAHRARLALGLGLMLVNRTVGLVLPATSKFLVDDVIGKGKADLLPMLALAAAGATVVQAVTSFSLSQILSVAAQRAIAEMRKNVNDHVMRLPVRYFDTTQTGQLISRIMNDAEGIRNLIGTGLVQLTGGFVEGGLALGVLFWLNWRLTTITLVVLVLFGGGMAYAFKRLRPIFRERGEIQAQVTGRLAQSLGGVRVVKAYVAEDREQEIFSNGVYRLFDNVRRTITGISATTAGATVIVGVVGVVMILVGGQSILSGEMTLGDFIMYLFFTAMTVAPVVSIASIGTQISEAFAGLDRIRELKQMATEDQEDASRASLPELDGDVRFEEVGFEYNRRRPRAQRRLVPRPRRDDHRAGRVERVRQEHAHLADHDLQPAEVGARGRGRPRPAGRAAPRLPQPPRHRAAGQLPVRRDGGREHRVCEARRHAATTSGR